MPTRTPRHSFGSAKTNRHTFKAKYDGEWRRLRARRIAEEPLCRHCAAEGRVTEAREVDHIIPLAMGGRHEWDNTQSLCVAHHREKTAEDMRRLPR